MTKTARFTTALALLAFSASAFGADQLETCRAKLKQAQKLDVLRDLKWDGRSEPLVVIGPTFKSMAFDGKQGFVATVNCFLTAGKNDACVSFDVIEWRNGTAIGRYSACRLKMQSAKE